MLIPNLRIDVRVYQCSEDITYYVDCHFALVATSLLLLLFVKVKKWYSSNVMISICLWNNNALDKYKSDPKHQFQCEMKSKGTKLAYAYEGDCVHNSGK